MVSPLKVSEMPATPKRRMMQSLTVPGEGPNVASPSRWIPVPDIPTWPVLSVRGLLKERGISDLSLLDAGPCTYVMAGRVAIGWALRLAGLTAGDKVLVPAYHCTSMVDPLSCVEASPVFYRVNPDLSVNIDDIASKIDAKTRALIATNYFGFPQKLEALRKFCDDNDLVFIEDCAHSFFGTFEGRPLGSFGHYAVGSLPKFFPVREGGCLITNDPKAQDIALRPRGLGLELRQVFSGIEEANYCHRLAVLSPAIKAVSAVKRLRRRPGAENEEAGQTVMSKGEIAAFEPEWLETPPSGVAKWVSRHVSAGRMAVRRRENFSRMAAHFTNLEGCRPLFTQMPEGVVPFMFPLWIDNLSEVFPRLEDMAVPMQRFGQFLCEGVDETDCETSAGFSHHLVQLPCHQELRTAELDWILETVANAIALSRN